MSEFENEETLEEDNMVDVNEEGELEIEEMT